MKTLDQDVTVIDPYEAELVFRRDFEGARTIHDVNRAANQSIDKRLKEKDDVPLVEDFPLAPEEETPEFQHLETTLRLRTVRAWEHWKANTHLTLTAIIKRIIEENMRSRGGS